MIAALRGTLEARGNDWAVIAVGGISLKLSMPTSAVAEMGNPGDFVHVHTHLHVREDALSLFGFANTEDLALFETLIGISGIGPKAALAIISVMDPLRLAAAVAAEDTSAFARVPGIGKKTAGRLIYELKGKIDLSQAAISHRTMTGGDNDLVAALTSLGYNSSEVASALASLPNSSELPVEEKIRLALQHFASNP